MTKYWVAKFGRVDITPNGPTRILDVGDTVDIADAKHAKGLVSSGRLSKTAIAKKVKTKPKPTGEKVTGAGGATSDNAATGGK